ncbi:MAG: hypothetical protein JO314_03795 [Acidobacteria bacterium]|nr:hypothetical protein [Acidobacteriota bacterium]
MNIKKLLPLTISILVFSAAAWAQYGGKAEANRVKFPRGSSSSTLIGTLSNGEEMEFVFAARKGQRVMIRNTKPALFDIRVFSDELGLANDYNSSASFAVGLPEKGDYLLYVRKKPGIPPTGKFSVTLTVR